MKNMKDILSEDWQPVERQDEIGFGEYTEIFRVAMCNLTHELFFWPIKEPLHVDPRVSHFCRTLLLNYWQMSTEFTLPRRGKEALDVEELLDTLSKVVQYFCVNDPYMPGIEVVVHTRQNNIYADQAMFYALFYHLYKNHLLHGMSITPMKLEVFDSDQQSGVKIVLRSEGKEIEDYKSDITNNHRKPGGMQGMFKVGLRVCDSIARGHGDTGLLCYYDKITEENVFEVSFLKDQDEHVG